MQEYLLCVALLKLMSKSLLIIFGTSPTCCGLLCPTVLSSHLTLSCSKCDCERRVYGLRFSLHVAVTDFVHHQRVIMALRVHSFKFLVAKHEAPLTVKEAGSVPVAFSCTIDDAIWLKFLTAKLCEISTA